MKNLLTFMFIVLCTAFSAKAQLPSFDLGIKAGLNLAKLQADWANTDNRLGFQAGVWTRIGGAGLYVQPEVYLGSKGGKFGNIESNGTTISGDGKVNFTTLDIPILIGNKIGFDKFNARLMAGPIISFLLKNDLKENYNMGTNFNEYKNQTIGAQIGAGVDLGDITFDLRFEKGLTNIDKSGQYNQKQNLWHLSLGYRLF